MKGKDSKILRLSNKFFIGTSGWMYKHWQGEFYPKNLKQEDWLKFYSERFKTVEINSTFYHSAKLETYEKWQATVPEGFVFSVKANRFITHLKKLEVDNGSIIYQFECAKILGKKLGVVLFQLQANFKRNLEKLEMFLDRIDKLGFKKVKKAFEFRHESWFDDQVYRVLKKHNCALVIQDSAGRWPSEDVITAGFVFLRFHGASYSTKYSKSELKKWADKLKEWDKESYVYFNNDVNGYAFENARMFEELISN